MCPLFALLLFLLGFEITQNAFLSNETTDINSKYTNFMKYSLKNMEEDYPYLIINNEYLCKNEEYIKEINNI